MQKQIVFLVLLFGLSAHADLATKIDKLNSTLKNVGNPSNSECLDCQITGTGTVFYDNGSTMRSCVESICPSKDFSLSGKLEKIYEGTNKPNKSYENQIQPLIAAITKEDAYGKNATAESTLEWLKNSKNLDNPGAIRTYNLISATNSSSKFQYAMVNGSPGVDVAKSRKNFPELSDDEYAQRVRIGNKALSAFLDKAIVEEDPARVQLVYGNKFKDRVNEVIASFEDKKKIIESDPDLKFLFQMKNFKEMVSGENLQKQFSDSGAINPETISNLNRANAILNLFVAAAKDPEFKKMLDSGPIDLKKEAAKLGTEQLLAERIKKQKAVLSGAEPILSAKCRAAFEMGQQVLPTQKELDAYKAKVEILKSKFLDKTKSLVCESSAKDYQTKISSLKSNLPLTKEQHLANMKESLSRALVEEKSAKIKREETDKSEYRDAYYAIGIGALKADHNNPTSASDDVCEELMPNLTPDATTYFGDSFVSGPVAIKHKEGHGISNHELGHKLFHFMSYENFCGDKSQFTKARTCLTSLHEGDSKYESEDWADMISAQVDIKGPNFACYFARKLNDEDYKNLSMTNSEESDVHSSELFRLLHVNFIKTGKVPAQCLHALSARGEQANFKNCLRPE